MKQFVNKIIDLGVTPELDSIHQNRIRIINKLVSVTFLLVFLNAVINVFIGKWIPALTIMPMLLCFIVILLCNHFRRYNLAQSLMLILPTLFITNQFLLYGDSVNLHPYYLVLAASVFLVHRGKMPRILFLTFIISCFIISQVLPRFYTPPLLGESHEMTKILHLIICAIVLSVLVAIAIEELERYKASLEKQSELLLRKNTELEDFAYVASHDLKTPLHNINNFLGLIETGIEEKDYEDLPVFLNFAKEGSQKMVKLINDLLTYSRIQNIKETQTIEDLNLVFQEAKSNMNSSIQKRNAIIECQELPVYLVNKSLFLMLFQNLLENGIKYNKSKQPKIEVDCKKKNDTFELSFKDNGIGIDSEFHEKIFVMFQRLHTTEKYKGSGIGLSMCKKIVEEHNGVIYLDSEIGKGTTFKMLFPLL